MIERPKVCIARNRRSELPRASGKVAAVNGLTTPELKGDALD
jgi:hypothetical protein